MAGSDFLTGVVLGWFDSLYGSWLPQSKHPKRPRQNLQGFLMLFNSLTTAFPPHSISQPSFKGQGRHKGSILQDYASRGRELSSERSYHKAKSFSGTSCPTCVWVTRKARHPISCQHSLLSRSDRKTNLKTHVVKASASLQPSESFGQNCLLRRKKVEKFLLGFENSQPKKKKDILRPKKV